MARKPRYPGYSGYYHVIIRGNGKQILFEDDKDYRYMLDTIKRYMEETDIQICAYCLMENHVHLLICDRENVRSLFMKKIEISYAWYYNHRYERVGNLFQGRYLCEAVDTEVYLMNVFRYILKNPEKAGIEAASGYRWSSYSLYGRIGAFVNTRLLESLIGDWNSYERFIRETDDNEYMEYDGNRHDDEWAKSIIREKFHIKSGTEIQKMDKAERDNAIRILKRKGLSVRQIERLTGINRGTIFRL